MSNILFSIFNRTCKSIILGYSLFFIKIVSTEKK